MEYDRYQHNKMLFIISITSLIIGLALLLFSFFILPHLIWELHYNIPEFIYILSENIKENHKLTNFGARIIVFFIFFSPGVLAIFIAYLTSNTIDNELYDIHTPQSEFKTGSIRASTKETLLITLQLLILIGLVLIGIYSLHWLLSVPPQTYRSY